MTFISIRENIAAGLIVAIKVQDSDRLPTILRHPK